MKKNLFLRIALLMLIATISMSAVFMGSGTFSKYAITAAPEARGTVAKFDVRLIDAAGVEVSGNLAAASTTLTPGNVGPLTLEDTPGTAHSTGSSGSIWTNDGSLIAPGTQGKASVRFRNLSQVRIRITMDTTGSPATIPTDSGIQFSHTGTGNWTTFGAAVTAAIGSSSFELAPSNGTAGVDQAAIANIYWKWPFGSPGFPISGNDANDTALGVAANEELIIPLAANIEQVD